MLKTLIIPAAIACAGLGIMHAINSGNASDSYGLYELSDYAPSERLKTFASYGECSDYRRQRKNFSFIERGTLSCRQD